MQPKKKYSELYERALQLSINNRNYSAMHKTHCAFILYKNTILVSGINKPYTVTNCRSELDFQFARKTKKVPLTRLPPGKMLLK